MIWGIRGTVAKQIVGLAEGLWASYQLNMTTVVLTKTRAYSQIPMLILTLATVNSASAADSAKTSVAPATKVSDAAPTRFQVAAMGGFIVNGRDDLDSTLYKHQVSQSLGGRIGFHYSVRSQRPWRLLVGTDILTLRHVQVASSTSATATYTADEVYVGPTVGLAWTPSGIYSSFQIQGLISAGWTPSRKATLQSPGFNVDLHKSSLTTLAAWVGLYGTYTFAPNWRLTGGFSSVGGATPFLMGLAYAF